MTSTNAHVLRQARAARTRMLRRRVIGGAVALFIAVWVGIAAVLVSGHDPALIAKASSTTQAPRTSASDGSSSTSDSSGSDSSSFDNSSSSDNSGSTSSSSGATASSSPSSVTTHSS